MVRRTRPLCTLTKEYDAILWSWAGRNNWFCFTPLAGTNQLGFGALLLSSAWGDERTFCPLSNSYIWFWVSHFSYFCFFFLFLFYFVYFFFLKIFFADLRSNYFLLSVLLFIIFYFVIFFFFCQICYSLYVLFYKNRCELHNSKNISANGTVQTLVSQTKCGRWFAMGFRAWNG